MSTSSIDALHTIHTATNDVLKGYKEMSERAEPSVQAVIHRLTEIHQRHAAEQVTELARLHEESKDDSSLQGSVNKAVVILRDWLSKIDRDVLPAVRQGEEALLDEYEEVINDGLVSEGTVSVLLNTQRDAIKSEISRLPKQ